MTEDPRTSRTDLLWVALCAALGLLLRLDFLVAAEFAIDSDEAIVGLMAKHMAAGTAWPVFYYGQHYMGSLEPLLVAAGFRMFGQSNVILLGVPLLVGVALIPLTFVLTRQLGNVLAARLATLYMAVPPTSLTVWSTKARGGFIEVLFLGALALWVAARFMRRPDLARTLLLGAILGLGWWVNNQIIFFIVPIGLFALARLVREAVAARRPRLLVEHGLAAVVSFIAGGIPFWLYNLQHDFVSFGMFKAAGGSSLGDHVAGLFSTAIPIILGAERFWQAEEVFPGSVLVAYLAWGIILCAIVAGRRTAITRLLRGAPDEGRPIELYLTFIVMTPLIFTVSSFGWLVEAPRYLLPMYVGLSPLFGLGIIAIASRSRILAAGVAAAVLTMNLASSYLGGRAVPGEPFVAFGERVARDHSELIDWLDSRGVRWVRTNYWIGYKLAFETDERIRFLNSSEPFNARIPAYLADSIPYDPMSFPLVMTPRQGKLAMLGLRASRYEFKQASASGYTILYDIESPHDHLAPIDPSAIVPSTELGREPISNAFDGDLTTRWGTGRPQAPGQRVRIRFVEPVALKALRYEFGSWIHDYPRALAIELVYENGERARAFGPQEFEGLEEVFEVQTTEAEPTISGLTAYFDGRKVRELELVQLGSHPIFDWSIAELRLFK